MRSILFLGFLFLGTLSFGQSDNCSPIREEVYRYMQKKDEVKECLSVIVCDNAVQFYLTATSVRTFHKLEGSVWTDHKQRLVRRVMMNNGFIAFLVNDEIFMYKPKSEL